MMCLPAPAGWDLLLTLLRPHLNELFQQRERARDAVRELTTQQWELLRLVAAGQSNPNIANRLFVSVHTVLRHLENVFSRLSVTSRTAAVARAFLGVANQLAKNEAGNRSPMRCGPYSLRQCGSRAQLSMSMTRVSGWTPSCFIASAPAELCSIACNSAISEMVMLRPTRFGFCGSVNVTMSEATPFAAEGTPPRTRVKKAC